MDAALFFSLYLPALEEAFARDEIYPNGNDVLSPEWYINKEWQSAVYEYQESDSENQWFLEGVAHYFHELSHGSDSWDYMELNEFKRQLVAEKDRLKAIYLPQRDKPDE